MTDKLLIDAIAEARQVKAAAIANAKLQLEEAFKPHLASMLTTQLRNEMGDPTKGTEDGYGDDSGGPIDKGKTDKSVVEQAPPDPSDIGKGDNKEPDNRTRSSSKIDNPGQELKTLQTGGNDHYGPPEGESQTVKLSSGGGNAETEGDGHEKVLKSKNKETIHNESVITEDDEFHIDGEEEDGEEGQPPVPGAEPPMDGGPEAIPGAEDGGIGGAMGGEVGGGEELDLDALIRELEADVLGADANGAAEEVSTGFAPSGIQSGMATEDISAAARADGHKSTVPFGSGDAYKAPAGAGSSELELGESAEVDEDVNLDEILREVEAENESVMDGANAGKDPHYRAHVDNNTLRSENVTLQRRLKEHREVVKFLKDRISEINMLNAKLLFTNKLFKECDLNSGQKMQVVETFDRATTLREVKLIYTTLAESYANRVKNSAKKPVSQITEGLASRATGSTKPKSQPQVINETDAVRNRFKKLAGILHS